MFIPLWILIPVIVLVLYRTKKLLDVADRQQMELKLVISELSESSKCLARHQRLLAEFQDECAVTTAKRYRVKMAIREVRHQPTSEQLERLERYAFDDESQLKKFKEFKFFPQLSGN